MRSGRLATSEPARAAPPRIILGHAFPARFLGVSRPCVQSPRLSSGLLISRGPPPGRVAAFVAIHGPFRRPANQLGAILPTSFHLRLRLGCLLRNLHGCALAAALPLKPLKSGGFSRNSRSISAPELSKIPVDKAVDCGSIGN